jgi:hypothetical protein
MASMNKQLAIAVAASFAISPVLAGCAPVPADDDIAAAVEGAVNSRVSNITGSFARLGYSGTNRTVWVRLYLESESPDDLAAMIDETFECVWDTSAVQPSRITIDAHVGERPDDVQISPRSGIDLRDAADQLGIGDEAFDKVVVLSAADLVERYGAWTAPQAND